VLFLIALLVLVEAPIMEKIAAWTVSSLPPDWEQMRDRWKRSHLLRVFSRWQA